MGYPWAAYIDPVSSILLSGFILRSAYSIISSSMTELLDRTLDGSMQLVIMRALAEFFNYYTRIPGVKSRQSGGIVFIEITLGFDSDMRMSDVQSIVNRMQESLESNISNSMVTIVPGSAG